MTVPGMRSCAILCVPALLAASYAVPALSQANQPLILSDPAPILTSRKHESCDGKAKCGRSSIVSSIAIMSEPSGSGGVGRLRIIIGVSNGGPDTAFDAPIIVDLPRQVECDDAEAVDVNSSEPLTQTYRISELFSSTATIDQLELGQSVNFSFQCQGS